MSAVLGAGKGKAPTGGLLPVNGGSQQTKKLVIKPLKVKPELPANFEEATWSKLHDCIQAVHCKRPVSCSLEELYTAVQDMCMHKMADKLYSRLQQECDSHISAHVSSLADCLSLESMSFLDRVDAVWQDHCSQMLMTRQIFLYLDRTHVLQLSSSATPVKSIFDMGLALFRGHLAARPEIKHRTVEGLLELIERERCGEAVNRPLLKGLLRMLSSLGIYADAFHEPFMRASTQFYRAEGERLVAELDVPAYLRHCETRLSEEYERSSEYLDPSSRRPLISAVEAQLVGRHTGPLLERGLGPLLDGHRLADLGRLYGLLSRVAAADCLRLAFREHVRTTGLALVKDEEKDKEMVERLLDLKARLDEVVASAFGRTEPFLATLRESFEYFINQRANKPAELIAKFIDARLRAGGRGAGAMVGSSTAVGGGGGGAAGGVGGGGGGSEEELEAALDRALTLFRFIQGKDVFEAFYKKDLAKRLLLGRSASVDAEKAMIAKLKVECGSQFTAKLEGMFKDVELSDDVMAAFRASAAAAGLPPGVDVTVSVLTSGYWPTYPVLEVKLPETLDRASTVFRDFYLSKYSGRRLVWQHSLGSCVLRAAFPRGLKELSVSSFQAAVLLLFNDVDTLSYKEIAAGCGLEEKELKRTLQSLACGKVRVLTKDPKGRDVGDTDSFSFNAAFSEKLFRIKINSIQMKETEEENKKTNEQVLQDRQYQIDAALVRIMKTRKTLSHKLLVAEALQQLKFPLKAADLKKRIESLIDREYMARDPSDANVYNYLA
ncbi:hypothetical protein PLESTB_001467900 [Pleodorina starrii]|uniref:Cullin family profile domain-containing protein n=1 Tax=Pleodorina starrii TaxID=330485 RepID=A0A9W6F7K7_9CHLO|nr:hypothetical protein PLESTM_001686200 [Pleodorina starrii]GLC59264.1 hypothetical protein PLESTB_001467900 [Pleodorina starrii]GLC74829.1 hypothetical protein PLESTF_001560500 [Pleodorina starrii]